VAAVDGTSQAVAALVVQVVAALVEISPQTEPVERPIQVVVVVVLELA
jgi:hypothetical protein